MNETPQSGIELAPLPRDRVGPFLILGVAKDADADAIESHWAQRVLWARQGKTQTALGDIHWARETLRDAEQRLAADVTGLNVDLASEELRRIVRRYHLDPPQVAWPAVEPEPEAIDSASLPEPASEQSKLPSPRTPIELPAVNHWLETWAHEKIDPWSMTLLAPESPGGENDE